MAMSLNGGTEAPTRRRRGVGRGKAVSGMNPQGRGMMNPPGEDHPAAGVNPQGQGMMNPPGQDQSRQGRGKNGGGKIGLQGAGLPGPGGRQLQARVQSGAITEQQAQKTMQQRQTLQKAFGKDWRQKISGSAGGQSFSQINAGLKKNPGNASLAALRKKLLAGRSSALEAARKKNKGEGEEGGE